MAKPLALGARHHGGSSPLYPTFKFKSPFRKGPFKLVKDN